MAAGPGSGVLAALRAATAPSHARLEAIMDLDSDGLTRDRYGAALQVLLAVRSGWEPELEVLFPGTVDGHRDWLAADLAALDLSPLRPEPPLGLGPEEGWGVRYVLEGSALGGRVLLRRAERLGLGAERGARYFAGRGAETGPRWKGFLAALDGAGTPAAVPAIVSGAERAFAALGRRAAAVLSSRR